MQEGCAEPVRVLQEEQCGFLPGSAAHSSNGIRSAGRGGRVGLRFLARVDQRDRCLSELQLPAPLRGRRPDGLTAVMLTSC